MIRAGAQAQAAEHWPSPNHSIFSVGVGADLVKGAFSLLLFCGQKVAYTIFFSAAEA